MERQDSSIWPCFSVPMASCCWHLVATHCPVSSAKPIAQLIFLRWQRKVLYSRGGCVASPSLLCLSACGSQLGGASAQLAHWGDAGEVCQLQCPVLVGQGCTGCCRLTAAMELVWGSVSAAAAHGSVSGIAMITKPWHACDTFTEVSDHCCTTEGWFAAALNHQGRGSHWQRAVQEGCAEAGVGENGKGSCLLEGIRCSSECGEGITGSPTCQAVLIGRTEEEYELNNCPAINF